MRFETGLIGFKVAVASALVVAVACQREQTSGSNVTSGLTVAEPPAVINTDLVAGQASGGVGGCAPPISSALPFDLAQSSQDSVNCFAWTSFIALNWPADPTQNGVPDPNTTANKFGDPADLTPTVWESFKPVQEIFLPKAAAPALWNSPSTLPSVCGTSSLGGVGGSSGVVLQMTSKASGGVATSDETLSDEMQATHQMLIDQASNPVRFEKRVNQDEFDYIVNNQLYDADQQYQVATTTGLVLPGSVSPSGGNAGTAGAIEIKAAWRQLDNVPANLLGRYKKVMAYLYDPASGTCDGPHTMGLIALHILRKTATLPHLMWSTFEQVDNVDDGLTRPTGTPYNLYNPACSSAPGVVSTSTATPCAVNQPPSSSSPPYAPVQVQREVPIPQPIQVLNTSVQTLIHSTNQYSVWQYYQLINVLWPQNGGTDPARNASWPISLFDSGFIDVGPQALSNSALETYVQTTTCTSCHVDAAIAPSKQATCAPKLASDFSFVFDDADTATGFRSGCATSGG